MAVRKSGSNPQPVVAQKRTATSVRSAAAPAKAPQQALSQRAGQRPAASAVRQAFGNDELSKGLGTALRQRATNALGSPAPSAPPPPGRTVSVAELRASQAKGGSVSGTFTPSASAPPPVIPQAVQTGFRLPHLPSPAELINGAVHGVEAVVHGTTQAAGNVFNAAAQAGSALFGAAKSGLEQAWGIAGGVIDTAKMLTQDPGKNGPFPVARAAMTPTDKAVVNALGLDSIPPGASVKVEVTANAELAAVAGVEVGAKVNVEIERSAEDPNKYVIKLGGGVDVSGELTGNTSGGKANGSVGVGLDGGIELTVDLSQPGGATQLAAFAAHTGVLGALPAPIAGAALAIESLPGVNLPGEPMDFVREHLTAIEVGASGKISEELGAVLGAGVTGAASQYLQSGGRIEFNPDGTLTLTASAGAGADVSATAGVGVSSLAEANIAVGGASVELGFEASITVRPTIPPQEISRSFTATMTVAGNVLGAGGEGTVSIDLDSTLAQAPAELRERMQAALERGDPQTASTIFQDEILGRMEVKGTLELAATSSVAGGLELKPEEAGVGGGVGLGGSVSTTVPVGSVEVTVSADGITPSGSLFGADVAGQTLSWQEIAELAKDGATA